MIDLNEIIAACEAATPGPWRRVDGPTSYDYATLHDADDMLVTHINKQHNARDANIDFIARARTWLPALVAELREARAKIDAQAAELRNIRPEVERLRGARAVHGNAILDSVGVLCIEEANGAQSGDD